RKDNRPLIAALGDDITVRGNHALQLDEPAANNRTAGDGTGGGGDFRSAQRSRNVRAVEQHTTGRHLQLESSKQMGERVLVVEFEFGAKSGEGDGPVHGTG